MVCCPKIDLCKNIIQFLHSLLGKWQNTTMNANEITYVTCHCMNVGYNELVVIEPQKLFHPCFCAQFIFFNVNFRNILRAFRELLV